MAKTGCLRMEFGGMGMESDVSDESDPLSAGCVAAVAPFLAAALTARFSRDAVDLRIELGWPTEFDDLG